MSDRTRQPEPRQLRRNPEITRRVGENLRRARLARDLTQAQLATSLDEWTDTMTVSRWERGIHRPHKRRLVQLAEILGVEVEWFFEDHGPEEAAA